MQSGSVLVPLATPVLTRLAGRLGEAAHLSVLDGPEVVTVLSVPATAVAPRVPASCTASGRVLLFGADAALLRRLFPGEELPPQGRGGPRNVAELQRRIAAARILGCAVVDQELQRGLVGIAAPVRDGAGQIVAAVNVSGPKFRLGTQLEVTAAPHVKRAADALSRTLMDRAVREGGHDG
jgi:DNA-binding IclR family transcriptional regulator